MLNPLHYGPEELAADLRAITAATASEAEIFQRVKPLARRMATSAHWVRRSYYEAGQEQGFGVHLLHEEPDHTLAVFAVSWLPGRGTPPHDHGTWAIVAGVDGPEKNTYWKRLDDGARPGHARLKRSGARVFLPGHVAVFPTGAIHSVWNDSARVSLSLHIYGKHLNYTGRSQFDPEAQTVTPFLVEVR